MKKHIHPFFTHLFNRATSCEHRHVFHRFSLLRRLLWKQEPPICRIPHVSIFVKIHVDPITGTESHRRQFRSKTLTFLLGTTLRTFRGLSTAATSSVHHHLSHPSSLELNAGSHSKPAVSARRRPTGSSHRRLASGKHASSEKLRSCSTRASSFSCDPALWNVSTIARTHSLIVATLSKRVVRGAAPTSKIRSDPIRSEPTRTGRGVGVFGGNYVCLTFPELVRRQFFSVRIVASTIQAVP